MERRRRICIVLGSYYPFMQGGVETLFTTVFQKLIEKTGWDIEVLVRRSRRKLQRVFPNPLPCVTLPSLRTSFFGKLFEFIYLTFVDLLLFGKSVASLHDTYFQRFDMVLTPDPIVTVEMIRRRKSKHPMIVQFVSGAWAKTLAAKQPLLLQMARKIETRAYNEADCTIFLDKKMASEYFLDENIYEVIPNSVDTTSFDPIRFDRSKIRTEMSLTSQKVIVTVASLRRGIKGHDYLLKAIPSVVESFPDAHFYLIGKGNQKWLKDLAISLNIENNLHILGALEDIHDMLSASDLFILPSLSEGTPASLLEAMSMEIPCIASDVGNIPEVIRNNKDGILIKPGNSRDISKSIISFFSNPTLYKGMGKTARQRVKELYSLESVVDKYISVIDELLENPT